MLLSLACTASMAQDSADSPTVAGDWIGATLAAIRLDFARPPVQARNLFHVSAVMYDTWAAFETEPSFVFLRADDSDCGVSDADRARFAGSADKAAARSRAIAAAAHRLLSVRFQRSPGAASSLPALDTLAARYGVGDDDASGLGVRIANCLLAQALQDNANEALDYANRGYEPVNPPLDPRDTGNVNLADPDRWQPLRFDAFVDQSGNPAEATSFIGANWGDVEPFALPAAAASSVRLDGIARTAWLDPGPPPRHDDTDGGAAWAAHHALAVQWSAHLDPRDGTLIDISPAALGNTDDLAELVDASPATQLSAYDAAQGRITATGIARNPATGEPYDAAPVPRGDWTRVIAEYWADGPDSETPPGHWFRLYREQVATHPGLQRRLGGAGDPLDPLAFDIVAHLALGGALHDAAIAAWSNKAAYDSVRPISAVRWMAGLGQRSDPTAANYHPDGLPLVPGRIESIMTGDPLAGTLDRNVGKLKGYVWRGPTFVRDASTDIAGVGWILLENWWPYQRANFVTPPFAGYVSGHSTFSRAAASVLEALTGDAFFPGGLATFTAPADDFLVFERGPSVDVTLQWATYRDAANESGLSRIWGGIHPPADDVPGRAIGEQVGELAWQRTLNLYAGTDAATDDAANASSSGGCSIDGRRTDGVVWLLLIAAAWGAVRRLPRLRAERPPVTQPCLQRTAWRRQDCLAGGARRHRARA